jgi:hypothetical protein
MWLSGQHRDSRRFESRDGRASSGLVKSASSPTEINLIFVVDGAKLEAQACLLAASIQRHFPKEIRRIAYHRQDYTPSDFVKACLERCGVELRTISRTSAKDPNPWSRHWPVGNKLLCKAEPRDCDITVYLDTDMYFRDFVSFDRMLGDAEVMASTADYLFGPLETTEAWQPIYAHFGLDVPAERRRLLAGRKLNLPPYYNGGFAVFREGSIGETEEHFGQAWFRDSLDIDHSEGFDDEREGLDQTVLPVTIERMGVQFQLAPATLNYNVAAHGAKDYAQAALVHYHTFSALLTHHPNAGFEAFENLEAVMPEGFLQAFTARYHEELNWGHPKNMIRRKLCADPDGGYSNIASDLNFLAERMGSDKGPSKHRYTELYQMLFWPFVEREINFLEMGLLRGGPEQGKDADRATADCPSIRMWLSYFKKARIHGLDVSDFSWFRDERFSFYRCDMGNRRAVALAARALPDMDIIIDDASHASHHQQNAFLEFFPRLRRGGLYLIEDLRWQPTHMEQEGITKTGDLFFHYQVAKEFKHSDPEVEVKLNALKPMIAGCFVFQEGYHKKKRNQVAVIQKMP